MAINFDSFQEGTTSTIQSNDYVVGFDTAVPGGERKYLVSTIANAVSGLMSTQLNNLFVERSNFTGTNQSIATNGYQKLPGGLIIQWGFGLIDALPGSYYKNITLPIAFPTGGLAVVFHNGVDDTTPPTRPGSLYFVSASTLQGRVYENQSHQGYWIALGY